MKNILRISRELLEYFKDLKNKESEDNPFIILSDYFLSLYSNKDIEQKVYNDIISEDMIFR